MRAALELRFGTTDRARIAEIVFSDPDQLEWLESLLHPRVQREYAAWLGSLDGWLAVVEVPLLYETGAERGFDAVVVITAPAEVRAARTSVQLEQRSDRLIHDDEKVRRADFAYVNDGTLEELDEFVAGVVGELRCRS